MRAAIALALAFLSLALVRCGGDSDATCGPKPIYPCAHCGSDVLNRAECVDGNWECPGSTMFTNQCPDGTCFGPPVSCCGPNGEKSAGICHVSENSTAPSGGPCPVGWVACYTLYDAGPPPPDSGSSVADCVAQSHTCQFCCGSFFGQGEKDLVASVQTCVCAGPCNDACADSLYCQSLTAPSDDCMACIVGQLEPDASCSTAACTSAECGQYLDCLTSCSP